MLPLNRRVYLDYNATTPPLEEVLDAQREAAHVAWANPSSIHADGRKARAVVEDARARIAELVGCDPRDVILTSGGTEANNIGIKSAMAAKKGSLVTSRLEHPSVVKVAEALDCEGREIFWCPADSRGAMDLAALEKYLQSATVAAFAIQAVNSETGIIQPMSELRALALKANAWLHVDAVQAIGRVEETAVGATSRSISAHKLRGPKGVGALVTQADVKIEPVLRGGAQERGLRPGTVDPIAAAGFGVAAVYAKTSAARYAMQAVLRDAIEAELVALGGTVNGSGPRAPHVTNVSFPKWTGAELVAALDLEGISISSGSACSAGTIEPSTVLAEFVSLERANSAVRISLGVSTSRAEVDLAIQAFRKVIARST
ncbi:MAG: cysteine desulfurase family protein [Polyangiaceae bacterium]